MAKALTLIMLLALAGGSLAQAAGPVEIVISSEPAGATVFSKGRPAETAPGALHAEAG